ncbi:cell wall-binding protein [Paenibacillus pinisoli]|uniref:Cell wall-binding protein n=2 Tax=Paenibacillus pinisoli TaxID=1276110 RepID=A0A3A6PEH2_9BACL|nr:cell wall-binding protein [Paenibacillus pinisoli]
MNQARRDVGVKYKDVTPGPLRDYIYAVNKERYGGDPLGPTYEFLKADGKTDAQIIKSSSRPNPDVNKLLSGFEEWLRGQ